MAKKGGKKTSNQRGNPPSQRGNPSNRNQGPNTGPGGSAPNVPAHVPQFVRTLNAGHIARTRGNPPSRLVQVLPAQPVPPQNNIPVPPAPVAVVPVAGDQQQGPYRISLVQEEPRDVAIPARGATVMTFRTVNELFTIRWRPDDPWTIYYASAKAKKVKAIVDFSRAPVELDTMLSHLISKLTGAEGNGAFASPTAPAGSNLYPQLGTVGPHKHILISGEVMAIWNSYPGRMEVVAVASGWDEWKYYELDKRFLEKYVLTVSLKGTDAGIVISAIELVKRELEPPGKKVKVQHPSMSPGFGRKDILVNHAHNMTQHTMRRVYVDEETGDMMSDTKNVTYRYQLADAEESAWIPRAAARGSVGQLPPRYSGHQLLLDVDRIADPTLTVAQVKQMSNVTGPAGGAPAIAVLGPIVGNGQGGAPAAAQGPTTRSAGAARGGGPPAASRGGAEGNRGTGTGRSGRPRGRPPGRARGGRGRGAHSGAGGGGPSEQQQDEGWPLEEPDDSDDSDDSDDTENDTDD